MNRKTKFTHQEVLELVIQFDIKSSKLKKIVEGEDSQAFSFNSKKYGECIIRINNESFGFKKDKLAWESFSSNLSIPEIFQIDKYKNAYYCISKLIEGKTVQDINEKDLLELCRPINDIWKTLKAKGENLSGYGPLNLNNTGQYESWQSYLEMILKNEKWKLLEQYMSKRNVEELYLKLERLIKKCPEKSNELIHGDFGANNLLSNGREITGIIDWDSTMRGDGLYDVAIAFYWSTWLPCMRIQSQFWKEELKNIPYFHERIKCYQLQIGLTEIFECIHFKDSEMLSWHIERVKTLKKI